MSETMQIPQPGAGHNGCPEFNYVYKPSWVANTFLAQANVEGIKDVDPLKIQKLVYNFHGWHLATTGRPAIGEGFEAWPNGPVVSSLYHIFKNFRWNRITDYAKDIDPQTGVEGASVISQTAREFFEIFHPVWQRYKGYTGPELSAMTHAPGTPWTRAREAGMQYIPDEWIREYFVAMARGQLSTHA